MPFEFREIMQVRRSVRAGTRRQKPWESSAVFRNARRLRRIFAHKTMRSFCDESRSSQPHGCRKLRDQCSDEARLIVPLVNRKTSFRIPASQKQRCETGNLTSYNANAN